MNPPRKLRVTKRDNKWVSTGACVLQVFETWYEAMEYAHKWIENERAENRRQGIELANKSIRQIGRGF